MIILSVSLPLSSFIQSEPIIFMRQLFAGMLFAVLLLIGTVQASSQISPKDGLWLSLPPDSVKCIVLRLPQDAGLSQDGSYIFSVGCEPGPEETWADLSEQIVREVHEDNTVLIPVCFDTAGANKALGNCSAPYIITLSEAYTGTEKTWSGGTCVSEYADADIVDPADEPETGDDVRDILNDNMDMISAWFEQDTIYAKPGEGAVFNLSVQSYAELGLVVNIQSSLEVSPANARLSTSPVSPHQYVAFGAAAPQDPGTYTLKAIINPQDCQETYCTKSVTATLVVSQDDPPENTGFSVVLRPENIDVKEINEVIMTLSVLNNEDEARVFTSSVIIDPDDASSGFTGESVEIGPHESHSRVFTVIPGTSSKLYEINARAESGDMTTSDTAFISIDEMVTDLVRQGEGLGSDADIDAFITNHADSAYGSDLDEYGSLKDALGASGAQDTVQNQSTDWMDEYAEYYDSQGVGDDTDNMGIMWVIIPVVVIAVLVIVVIMFMRKGSSGKREESDGDVEYY